VIVNSQGAGYDENGNYITLGYPQYAVTTNNNSTIQATDIRVVGGVDTPPTFKNVPGTSETLCMPVRCRSRIPLRT